MYLFKFDMTLEKLPPHPDISLPDPNKLNKKYILTEVQDKLGAFKDLFPHVDLGVLQEQVTEVKKKNVSAEVCNYPTRVEAFLLIGL